MSKAGPITFGHIDKTGTKLVFSHHSNEKSKIVNLTIWQF